MNTTSSPADRIRTQTARSAEQNANHKATAAPLEWRTLEASATKANGLERY